MDYGDDSDNDDDGKDNEGMCNGDGCLAQSKQV